MNASDTNGISLNFIRQDNLREKVNSLSGKDESREAQMDRLNRLRQSSADFESYFVGQLLARMKACLPEGGYLAKSAGSDLYESMADEQFARYISSGNGLGLGQAIFNQMVKSEGLEDLAKQTPDLGGVKYVHIVSPDHMKHSGRLQAKSISPDQGLESSKTDPEGALE